MPAMSGKSYKTATAKGYGKNKVTKKKKENKRAVFQSTVYW